MKFKILIFTLSVLLFSGTDLYSQNGDYQLGEVIVTARRKLENIGVVRTQLDSTTLRDNIANSLADVIAQNTSIYIKSYGRGSMATASFRGTAPSHTKVTWNGMNLNSPMLGMVDFSLIPSYFIDDAQIYHGSSSVNVTGGGLGGAITLANQRVASEQKLGINFVQGISSYRTFDEFLKVHANINQSLQTVTRLYYTDSRNDFKYTNYDKIKNEDGSRIIERNKNGDFRDFHVLQELYYQGKGNNRFNLSAWYFQSKRGLPMLKSDHKEEDRSRNQQDENSLRVSSGWNNLIGKFKLNANLGYAYSKMEYWLLTDNISGGELSVGKDALSTTHTAHSQFNTDWLVNDKLMISGRVNLDYHKVNSNERTSNQKHYKEGRVESSLFFSGRYNISSRLGVASNFRVENYRDKITPIIPAVYVDYLLVPSLNMLLKGSVSKNYRYPTLNDLYFQPGGNPDLEVERGFTWDLGTEFKIENEKYGVGGEGSYFNSRIKDWILWEATPQGYWTPKNIKLVRSYGVELKANAYYNPIKDWQLRVDASWAVTNSINKRNPASENDLSVGKQLPYIPKYSSTATGRIGWKGWALVYKFQHYSQRHTSTSNNPDKLGRIAPYYMNDISLEKSFALKFANVSAKVNINNLFDEEYESVLSRPMAGRNYSLFIGINPKW